MASKKKKHGADTVGLTRGQVAKMFGTSISWVRRHEGVTLFPKKNRDGVFIFSRKEVEALVAERGRPTICATPDGEIAAQVFELFKAPVPLRDIVIQLRLAPERVSVLWSFWVKMSGKDVLVPALQKVETWRIAQGKKWDTAAELVEFVRELVAERDKHRAAAEAADDTGGDGE